MVTKNEGSLLVTTEEFVKFSLLLCCFRMKIHILTISGVSKSGYSRKQEAHNLSRSAL